MAACTSRAAPSTSRFRSNCIVMDVEPIEELDVIWLIPAIRLNCRSSGVAIADAIVSGSAPGNDAPTLIVGYSTCGRLETGKQLVRHATRQKDRYRQQKRRYGPPDKGRRKVNALHRTQRIGLLVKALIERMLIVRARTVFRRTISSARLLASAQLLRIAGSFAVPRSLIPGLCILPLHKPSLQTTWPNHPLHAPDARPHEYAREIPHPPPACADTCGQCGRRTDKPQAS